MILHVIWNENDTYYTLGQMKKQNEKKDYQAFSEFFYA